jgi:hypothetical protein
MTGNMRRVVTAVFVLTLAIGCGSRRPVAPRADDSAYEVSGVRRWYVTGVSSTSSGPEMTINVTTPRGVRVVTAWVDDRPPVRLRESNAGFSGTVPLAGLAAGSHDLLLSADDADVAFARRTFNRSAPYFILVTTDWDYADPGQPSLIYQDRLHANHPALRLTHFAAPYTFTDPGVLPARQAAIAAWLRAQRDTFDDEIGLHIHPYCSVVVSAGVRCITDQSTIYPRDATGYSVRLSAYDHAGIDQLLRHSIALFEQHGLGRPVAFRAGDWAATSETLRALDANGFTTDSSAVNWHRIEELAGTDLYRLAAKQWATVGDATQPYRPPQLGILEVPDNGAMIDYVSLQEMQELFTANWNTAAPAVLTVGFHPASDFSDTDYARIDGFLSEVDTHLAHDDLGPVVYLTMTELANRFDPAAR